MVFLGQEKNFCRKRKFLFSVTKPRLIEKEHFFDFVWRWLQQVGAVFDDNDDSDDVGNGADGAGGNDSNDGDDGNDAHWRSGCAHGGSSLVSVLDSFLVVEPLLVVGQADSRRGETL